MSIAENSVLGFADEKLFVDRHRVDSMSANVQSKTLTVPAGEVDIGSHRAQISAEWATFGGQPEGDQGLAKV